MKDEIITTPQNSTAKELDEKLKDFVEHLAESMGVNKALFGCVRSGETQISVKRKELKKTIEEDWVRAIEDSLVSLDICIRKPGRQIAETEKILPIELSRNITPRSLVHLSQHSDYISKVEKDTVIPSKILNVFRDETMLTYENKFINTLVLRLYIFINRRYSQLKNLQPSFTSSDLAFSSTFDFEGASGKINLDVSFTENSDRRGGEGKKNEELLERVSRLNSIASQYLNSTFCKEMGKNYVRPPILRTNAITKNKDLRQCLILWQFIESYEKIGYEISTLESIEKPDNAYIDQLYDSLALQYAAFRYNTDNIENDTLAEREQEAIDPKFVTDFDGYDVEDYNVYDTEYRKFVPVSQLLDRRRLSADERKIRKAIDEALKLDKEMPTIYGTTLDELDQNKIYPTDKEGAFGSGEGSGGANKVVVAPTDTQKELLELAKKLLQEHFFNEDELFPYEREREDENFISAGDLYDKEMPFWVYLARANNEVKSFYNTIKNRFLCFEDSNSEMFDNFEDFTVNYGTLARLSFSGKVLKLYLALNPDDYDPKIYLHKNVGDKPETEDIPLCIRLKSWRAVKRALRLIEDLAAKFGLAEKEDYKFIDFGANYPYAIYLDYIKKLEEKGDQSQKAFAARERAREEEDKKLEEAPDTKAQKAEELKQLIQEAEQAIEEELYAASAEKALDDDDDDDDEIDDEIAASLSPEERRKIIPFPVRLAKSSDEVKGFYSEIKNKLLGYKSIKSRISNAGDSFRFHRQLVAKMRISGKTLKLYLALDPYAFDMSVYHQKDAGDKKIYQDIPFCIKIKSKRAVQRTKELIAILAEALGTTENPKYTEKDYSLDFPYSLYEDYIKKLAEEQAEKGVKQVLSTEGSGDGVAAVDSSKAQKFGFDSQKEHVSPVKADIVGGAPMATARDNITGATSVDALSLGGEGEKFDGEEQKHVGDGQIPVGDGQKPVSGDKSIEVQVQKIVEAIITNTSNGKILAVHFTDEIGEGDIPVRIANEGEVALPIQIVEKVDRQGSPVNENIRYIKEAFGGDDVIPIKVLDSLDDQPHVPVKIVSSFDEAKDVVPIIILDNSVKVSEAQELGVVSKIDVAEQDQKVVEDKIPTFEEQVIAYEEEVKKPEIEPQLKGQLTLDEMIAAQDAEDDYTEEERAALKAANEAFEKKLRAEEDAFKAVNEELEQKQSTEGDAIKAINEEFEQGQATDEVAFTQSNLAEQLIQTEDNIDEQPVQTEDNIGEQFNVLEQSDAQVGSTEQSVQNKEQTYTQEDIDEQTDGQEDIDEQSDVLEGAEEQSKQPILFDINSERVEYKRCPFRIKMGRAPSETKQTYSVIKNALMCYTGVKFRESRLFETFKTGGIEFAKVRLAGKTIWLYLRLNPTDYDDAKFPHVDVRGKKAYLEVPMGVKVRSNLSLKRALKLIADTMSIMGVNKNSDYNEKDYTLDYPYVEFESGFTGNVKDWQSEA